MYTEEEKIIAGKLVADKEIMSLLKKIYCPIRPSFRTEIEAILAMPDEVYGQQMKACIMAEKHFADAHANIKRIALKEKPEGDMSFGVAPK